MIAGGSRRGAERLVSRSRGFTIAEIFAALLVMAVGVIGIAALYSDQVQTNPDAQLHIEAAALAEQIAERIRETKEGHAGFATTIGVVCEQQSKASCRRTSRRAKLRAGRTKSSGSCRAAWARSRATHSTKPPTFVIAVSWSAPDAGAASYVIRVTPSG